MTMRMTIIASVVLFAAACHRDDHRAKPAPSLAIKPLEHASQADLARELDEADRHATWGDVRHRWAGQHLRWTVTRYTPLCRTASECHVAAFPIQRPAKHGWMPALALASGEWSKIESGCGNAAQCELVIEGTVGDLEVSGDLPTSLKLTDVHVVSAHA
jgi:hypothetical protein